ncbi:MAG TPA: tRNA adenosine(34) deaminase TadA [Bdellovibrionales bacterium]|nr:tRNA adenosine(34) deaminase TadA [Bdellovibrionales bacterium]
MQKSSESEDIRWMQETLRLAQKAAERGEVPIGAVVVHEGRCIGSGYNWRETGRSPLAHAELIAIQKAAKHLGQWRLLGCTLYVNLEPCVMCAGAIVNSRLERVVYGTTDPKGGAVETLYQILQDKRLNHRPQVTAGVLAKESAETLSAFFKELRARKK